MKLAQNTPTTLRELGNAKSEFECMSAAVVLIDFQNEYLRGRLPLSDVQTAIDETKALLQWARDRGRPIIHILHQGSGGLFDIDADGGKVITALAPLESETVIYKALPDSFALTELRSALEASTPSRNVILAGLMTHMCLTATTVRSLEFGFQPLIIASTTTTRDLRGPSGETIPATQIKASALAALSDGYAILRKDVSCLT